MVLVPHACSLKRSTAGAFAEPFIKSIGSKNNMTEDNLLL